MRSHSKKRTTAKERELAERIRELEEKLAASVPKAEFETVKSNLQLEINDLKTRLSLAGDQASQTELSKPDAGGRLDEDEFEEREAHESSAEMEPSTEAIASGDYEVSETADSEDEDSEEETEAAESCTESRITTQSESGRYESGHKSPGG